MDWPNQTPLLPLLTPHSLWGIGLESRSEADGAATTNAWGTANRAVFVPLTLPAPFLIQRLFWINGTTISGNVDVGLYTAGGAKVAATGAVAASGASTIQSAAPSGGNYFAQPGEYFLATSLSSATGTLFAVASSVNECKLMGLAEQLTAHPLPDPATMVTVATNGLIPVIGISTVTLI